MEGEKEKISFDLSVTAAAGLDRLARHWKLSASEVVEKLLKKADSSEAEKAVKKGRGRLYYDNVP